jgi:hypothetical protein
MNQQSFTKPSYFKLSVAILIIVLALFIPACSQKPSQEYTGVTNQTKETQAGVLELENKTVELNQRIAELEREKESLQSDIANLGQSVRKELPPPLFFFEFGCGSKVQYDNALPILNEFGFKANFGLPISNAGRPGSMNISQLQQLVLEGHEVAMQGLAHEYPKYTEGGVALSSDANVGANELSLASVLGFGAPSGNVTLKAHIYDNANLAGQIIEITNTDLGTKKLTLQRGLTGNYTIANQAKVTLDNPICLEWIYSKSWAWLYENLGILDAGMICSGAWFEHLYGGKEEYYRDKYFGYFTNQYRDFPTGRLSSLYVGPYNSHSVFIPVSQWYQSLDWNKRWIVANANPGRFTGIYIERVEDGAVDLPNMTPDVLRNICQLVKDSGYRVVTLSTLVEYAKHYGSKIPRWILWKDTLDKGAETTVTECTRVDALGKELCFTVSCSYDASATAGAALSFYASSDGENWDTEPMEAPRVLAFEAGKATQQTVIPFKCGQMPLFVKCMVKNLDSVHTITDVKVMVTSGG